MRADLDHWLEAINAERPYTKVTKNELLVRLLEWALCTHPSLDDLSRAAVSSKEAFQGSAGAPAAAPRSAARGSERSKKGARV